jgi:hypothetical protein
MLRCALPMCAIYVLLEFAKNNLAGTFVHCNYTDVG